MAEPVFTSKTLSFLRALKKNNDRDWFREHRADYDAHVHAPMLATVERLAHDFATWAPDMVADPKVSMFRPWRDTRFGEDKTPLKTNVAAGFPSRALGRMQGAGLYFEVAPTWAWIGGGMYAPTSPQLQAVREHIAEDLKRFDTIVKARGLKKFGGLKGATTLRVPRGFAADHPAAAYLRHKQFLASREEPAAFATRPDFYKQLVATFKAILPLVRTLNEPLMSVAAMERRAHLLDQ